MSTTRIKEKISQLVRSQLPEYVSSDYDKFVTFIEAYYRFLEQDQNALEVVQNARAYADIDNTAESFVQYFLNNYLSDIPGNTAANNRFLVKKIRDLYTAKGSELSFQLLFRILFDENVLVKHPQDYVLRASDGGYNFKYSVAASTEYGSGSDAVGRQLVFVSSQGVIYSVEVIRVKNQPNNITEFYINPNNNIPFEMGGSLHVSNSNEVIFRGTIIGTPNSYVVTNPGYGFKKGQIFSINISGGTGTIIQILKVTATGGVERIKFIDYGYGYPDSFSIDLNRAERISTRSLPLITKTGGFSEYFQLLKPHTITDPNRYFAEDYITPYTPSTYTATVAVESTSSSAVTPEDISGFKDPSLAEITFYNGAGGRYPGQYASNKGFLSEPDVRLQDSLLYQPFAYQLETELDISKFYNIVKKLIHPAGTRLFNNRTITSTADITANVEVVTRQNVSALLEATFSTLDTVRVQIAKGFVSLAENANPIDTITLATTKPFSDSLDGIIDNTTALLNKPVDDTLPAEDSITLTIDPVYNDTVQTIETITKTAGININNNNSTVSLTESQTGFHVSYSDATYFAEYYVGEYLTFTS